MYDTIHMYLEQESASEIDMLAEIPVYLDNVTEIAKTDWLIYSGHLKNLKVSVTKRRVSIKGSLAKYYLGDNIQTLTRQDTEKAIEQLSKELNLPLEKAVVTRIDLAHNFIMKHEPKAYYNLLGETRYLKRYVKPNSLYYENSNRTRVFYDKPLQLKFAKEEIPEIWKDKNVLRYEIRYSKRLSNQLKEPELLVSTLFKESFYIKLVKQYISDFKSIHKVPEVNLNFESLTSPKDFFDQLIVMKIDELGDERVMELIEELRARNTFEKSEYYSRIKRDIRLKREKFSMNENEPLMDELTTKIERLNRFYR